MQVFNFCAGRDIKQGCDVKDFQFCY